MVSYFPRASITKCHKFGGMNNRNILSHSSGEQADQGGGRKTGGRAHGINDSRHCPALAGQKKFPPRRETQAKEPWAWGTADPEQGRGRSCTETAESENPEGPKHLQKQVPYRGSGMETINGLLNSNAGSWETGSSQCL